MTKTVATIVITQEMIDAYATISGDFNPLHVDPELASATPFGGTIAHGCIPMEPIFRMLGDMLGKPTLPTGTTMSLRYLRPSRPGDRIRIDVRPAEDEPPAAAMMRIDYACLNQADEIVLEGHCQVPR